MRFALAILAGLLVATLAGAQDRESEIRSACSAPAFGGYANEGECRQAMEQFGRLVDTHKRQAVRPDEPRDVERAPPPPTAAPSERASETLRRQSVRIEPCKPEAPAAADGSARRIYPEPGCASRP